MAEKGGEYDYSCGECGVHEGFLYMIAVGAATNLVGKYRLLVLNRLGAIYSRYWKRKLGIMDDGEV